MSDKIKAFLFAVVIGVVLGITMYLILISTPTSKPTKHYPIELLLHWSTMAQGGYPTMECDSIKGDTVYKDGNSIVVKNILNIKFK